MRRGTPIQPQGAACAVPRCAIALWLVGLAACSGRSGEAGGGTSGAAGTGGASASAGAAAMAGSAASIAGHASSDASTVVHGEAGAHGEALALCDGALPVAPAQPLCRTDADCAVGTARCQVPFPTPPNDCGAGCACPPAEPVSCSTHEECGSGRCFADGPFGVGCATGFCMPSCLDEGCGEGYACNADRVCEAIPCDVSFSCARGLRCAPNAEHADLHGCEPLPCDEGFTCQAGYACRPDDPRGVGNAGCVVLHCSEAGGPKCPVNSDCRADVGGTGCTVRACEHDEQCDCGACVNGSCAPRPGVCMSLAVTGG